MDFDLELSLVIATTITGIIWLTYILIFKRKISVAMNPSSLNIQRPFFLCC